MGKLEDKSRDSSIYRIIVVFVVILAMFAVLVVRIFNYQIASKSSVSVSTKTASTSVEGSYRIIMESNLPQRGNIYDVNGNLLAYNELVYNLNFYNSAVFNNNNERNQAIFSLITLLRNNGLEKEFTFPLYLDDNGKLAYSVTGNALYRFLKNCFGLQSVNNLSEEQKATTPEQLYEYLKKGDKITSMFGISDEYSIEDTLEIMSYRYQLYTNNPSYAPIRVVSGISDDFRIKVLENQANVPCVYISRDYKRIYNDSIYFAHIIGYIGKINENELAKLTEEGNTNYTSESRIGKLGLEQSFDSYLQGSLGETKITVNSLGQVVSREVVTAPVDGDDLYLSLDREAQIAAYYLVEKNVAAILISKLVNALDYGSKGTIGESITIPIYEVYASLITNNVIDISGFGQREMSSAENTIYTAFRSYKDTINAQILSLLTLGNHPAYKDCSQQMQDYMDYFYDALRNKWGILNQHVDTESDYFASYLEGNSSFSDFILACVENGNFDVTALTLDKEYYSSEEMYQVIYDYIANKLEDDIGYDRQIYRDLIFNGTVKGRDLCLILYDQGVLKEDRDSYNALLGYSISAYDFIKRKLNSLEITPAMLALRPCSGSLLATDPTNGSVLCMASYPSYDNNKLTNSIDYEYYSKLTDDKSYPMLCRATQVKTNTGSTFKPLTAIAALTEGTITVGTTITDLVKFDKITPSPSCWYRYGHGTINVTDAIMHSCNYFFYETAYRFSSTRGYYSDEQGLAVIHKYYNKFGFDALSGVEIGESAPEMSTRDAVRTSIGYNHSFAPVQIARYATTIASSGTCYNLTLVKEVKTKSGMTVLKKEPSIYNKLDEVDPASWNAVHLGMNKVVTVEQARIFRGMDLSVAGKTGTGQVSKNQSNNALFISFAPYENPEISVTAVIPNGYSSGNACKLVREFYEYYFKGTNKENLLSGRVYAGEANEIVVGD